MSTVAAPTTHLDQLKERLFNANALRSSIVMMDWDQQVKMPRGGGAARAEHLGRLMGMYHEYFTAQETWDLIEKASPEAQSENDIAMLRVVRRDYELSTKLPLALVTEKTRLAAHGHETWLKARATNDFPLYAPTLAKQFDVAKREAEALGYTDHPFTPLLDQVEEGGSWTECNTMFNAVKPTLIELVKKIAAKGPVDDSILYGDWDLEAQRKFSRFLADFVGFDFDRGRIDEAPHPFCTGWSIGDIRITTRYKSYLPSAIFGTLHEAGHGMYEQGSPMSWDRTPLAGGASLGVHESQSRTWENLIGRSIAFWTYLLPELKNTFPGFDHLSAGQFVQLINKVEPSYIRVEADEVTYNLHIIIRCEIEGEILTGKLDVKDVPAVWNAKYQEYLGITPRNDAEGCLQDVHWSSGAIATFPTYSIGNMLTYQFWNAMKKDLGEQELLIEKGQTRPILDWLIEKIYSQGKKYTPKELVQRVTGKPMGVEDYLAGLTTKYNGLYNL